MSSDEDLENIRQKKLLELQRRLLEEQNRTEQQDKLETQKQAILRQIITNEGRQRLSRLRLVKREFVEQVELQLIQIAQTGRIKLPITDEQLKQILVRLQPNRRQIRFRGI
jgi:programmed cell death protein 5